MAHPIFLTFDEVIILHRDQISRYGGSLGIRDVSLLQSALEMPKSTFGGSFLHEDLFMMAAAYLFHLVQNHAFIDGNKRIGLFAAVAFLDKNGIEIIADEDEAADLVLSVAQGQLGKEAIADFLRSNS
jgi:death-on-curing protein